MSLWYENDIDHSHGKYSIDFMAYIADPDEPIAQIIWKYYLSDTDEFCYLFSV